jgi:hypothetical protein
MTERDLQRALVGDYGQSSGPWFDVADTVVRKVLTSATCGSARAGLPCLCGCVSLLVRHVQERFEWACSVEIQAHKPDICGLEP